MKPKISTVSFTPQKNQALLADRRRIFELMQWTRTRRSFTAAILRHYFVDFLQRILVLDPAQRLTAGEALAHPFITLHLSGTLQGWNPEELVNDSQHQHRHIGHIVPSPAHPRIRVSPPRPHSTSAMSYYTDYDDDSLYTATANASMEDLVGKPSRIPPDAAVGAGNLWHPRRRPEEHDPWLSSTSPRQERRAVRIPAEANAGSLLHGGLNLRQPRPMQHVDVFQPDIPRHLHHISEQAIPHGTRFNSPAGHDKHRHQHHARYQQSLAEHRHRQPLEADSTRFRPR